MIHEARKGGPDHQTHGRVRSHEPAPQRNGDVEWRRIRDSKRPGHRFRGPHIINCQIHGTRHTENGSNHRAIQTVFNVSILVRQAQQLLLVICSNARIVAT